MNEAIEPLNPIAFQLGPLAVHWYGIIIGLGALLGLWIAMRESEKRGAERHFYRSCPVCHSDCDYLRTNLLRCI